MFFLSQLALEKYEEMFPAFTDSRECKLLKVSNIRTLKKKPLLSGGTGCEMKDKSVESAEEPFLLLHIRFQMPLRIRDIVLCSEAGNPEMLAQILDPGLGVILYLYLNISPIL